MKTLHVGPSSLTRRSGSGRVELHLSHTFPSHFLPPFPPSTTPECLLPTQRLSPPPRALTFICRAGQNNKNIRSPLFPLDHTKLPSIPAFCISQWPTRFFSEHIRQHISFISFCYFTAISFYHFIASGIKR